MNHLMQLHGSFIAKLVGEHLELFCKQCFSITLCKRITETFCLSIPICKLVNNSSHTQVIMRLISSSKQSCTEVLTVSHCFTWRFVNSTSKDFNAAHIALCLFILSARPDRPHGHLSPLRLSISFFFIRMTISRGISKLIIAWRFYSVRSLNTSP